MQHHFLRMQAVHECVTNQGTLSVEAIRTSYKLFDHLERIRNVSSKDQITSTGAFLLTS